MIAKAKLFAADPGHIFDFSGTHPAEIFNESVVPRVNSFLDLLGDDPSGLEDARQRREEELTRRTEDDMFAKKQDDDFLSSLRAEPELPMDMGELAIPEMGDYDGPSRSAAPARSAPPEMVKDPESAGFIKSSIKLANYGYDSDTSPDHNSNVLKIGHANNKLVDGYSAALTKTLAKRLGLKTGDEFDVITADGKVLTRRYDDTVPPSYKGKALPETVDLYETKGSNSFGGRVVGIRPVPKKKVVKNDPYSLDLAPGDGDISDYDNPLLPPKP